MVAIDIPANYGYENDPVTHSAAVSRPPAIHRTNEIYAMLIS